MAVCSVAYSNYHSQNNRTHPIGCVFILVGVGAFLDTQQQKSKKLFSNKRTRGWIRSHGTMCRLRATRDDLAALFITHKIFQILWGPMLAKSTWFRTCGSHLAAHSQKQKPTKMSVCVFWWEWVDYHQCRFLAKNCSLLDTFGL